MIQEDTICAVSTAAGEAGIGIIRISGKDAIEITDKIFKAVNEKKASAIDDRKVVYGHVFNSNGDIIDEVIVLLMRSPNSYTKEDIVEIQCHGNSTVLKEILLRTIEAGARLAERGEFTKRAFLNGRIDLSQAQAVLDIIQSKTSNALKLAEDKLSGKMSSQLNSLKQQILNIIAHIEAIIDFPEDDIGEIVMDEIKRNINLALTEINSILEIETKGKILQEGVSVAIIGKPNVGKSSLLNFLSRKEKSIVTDIPGTTRDIIEEYIDIEGIPLKIIDTAGIHNSNDKIEKIGIKKSKDHIEKAALILALFDSSREFDNEDEEILDLVHNRNTISLITKSDLPKVIDISNLYKNFDSSDVIAISVKNKSGMDNLKQMILKKIGIIANELTFVKNAREIETLTNIEKHIKDAKNAIEMNIDIDLISIDLRSALNNINELTGESVDEEIINEIFSKFCIGK